MTNRPAIAVVAGHGTVAAGLISAVAQIAGLGDRFVAVSNSGLSPAGLEDALREAIDATGARVIFTDLPAGSCTMAARRLARVVPGLTVVTGAALPTLLAFALGADAGSAAEQGRNAIAVVEAPRDA